MLSQRIKSLPDAPGVYLLKDKEGKVIYIGKAISLKKRVGSHFQRGSNSIKEQILVSKVVDLDYIVTSSEFEAMLLECNLIKEHRPRYNVRLKDDKRYPMVKITINEGCPRLVLVRREAQDGAAYFGPYTQSQDLRRNLRYAREIFPICISRQKVKVKEGKRPCLDFYMGRCLAPCAGKIDLKAYRELIEELIIFLQGHHDELTKRLKEKMAILAQGLRFEEAGKVRDQIKAIEGLSKVRFLSKEEGLIKVDSPLSELKVFLRLPVIPRRIEAFDVSNIRGKLATASLVVFEEGRPLKSGYRHFRIKTLDSMDDVGMIKEVIARRFKRLLSEKEPRPDLVLIDGGKTQLRAAYTVLVELGLGDLPLIGLAKPKEEEESEKIYTLNRKTPLRPTKDSVLLHLLQQIRDEAHRFAISYHRRLRRISENKEVR
ncbi:TPA: excinuclease ABC subunit C [bacterium]|nr:excinuclease ABC subunit C [bacterium]